MDRRRSPTVDDRQRSMTPDRHIIAELPSTDACERALAAKLHISRAAPTPASSGSSATA